jgi:hypothetical protein
MYYFCRTLSISVRLPQIKQRAILLIGEYFFIGPRSKVEDEVGLADEEALCDSQQVLADGVLLLEVPLMFVECVDKFACHQ